MSPTDVILYPVSGNPAARTAARIAADYDQYRNTPLPLRAAAAVKDPDTAVLETANAEDNADATIIPGEWRRMVVELRDLSEKAERSLTEFRKAIDQPDRFGVGGNNPPEAIRNTVVEAILAAKVVRDEVEADEPRWPVLGLALFALKRAAQAIGSWLADMWSKFSTAAAIATGTAVGDAIGLALAKQANVDVGAMIKTLERLFELVGVSF